MRFLLFLSAFLAHYHHLTAAIAKPNCASIKDSQGNGDAIDNTITAGALLMSYFYDPSRNGVLSLPAQGPNSLYNVQRQVNYPADNTVSPRGGLCTDLFAGGLDPCRTRSSYESADQGREHRPRRFHERVVVDHNNLHKRDHPHRIRAMDILRGS